ncbi:hypothetical protein KP509_18G080900 [Ceratopteris richardii]|uniref:Uncharacterized protein n=1 Tax=Ceratopteris richardii TaxID=49495 RepID=A0A8T2SV28_CERRI|nr:hypothetical protein KP509_18G080900 [Ceratopteris richardii]
MFEQKRSMEIKSQQNIHDIPCSKLCATMKFSKSRERWRKGAMPWNFRAAEKVMEDVPVTGKASTVKGLLLLNEATTPTNHFDSLTIPSTTKPVHAMTTKRWII